ncbi:unnamed protein product [Paramecium primaurelia]|uniref:Uncharacterized protein n=1 Tax=Paramecium primaurelia TaxID=5886 RepID=A0A8S1P1H3_PARPR|nr:unnamed protein product [Paramecium primaurelia]
MSANTEQALTMQLILLKLYKKDFNFQRDSLIISQNLTNVIEGQQIICIQISWPQLRDQRQQKKDEENQKFQRRRAFKIASHLAQVERKQILELQKQKFKINVIAAIFCITPSQVRQNLIHLKIIKQKEQLRITRFQQEWLLQQASFQSNQILFNAKSFLFAFKEQFLNQNVLISQFGKIYQHQIFDIEFLLPNLSSSLTKMEKEKRQRILYL